MTAKNPLSVSGAYPALATPFSKDGGSVDLESFSKLVEHVVASGVHGVVPCGSTGEASTLTDQEYEAVVRRTVEIVRGRIPVIAGIGGSSTARAAAAASLVRELDCDGILLVAPPYNKPSQEGIVEHFRAVHAAGAGLPIVAYNVPGRTVVSIVPQTVQRLWREKLIVGLKDATGSLDYALDVLAGVGDGFAHLSGEDSLILPIMACGGTGTISASANLAPRRFADLTNAATRGDFAVARTLQLELLPLIRTCFIESNPVPVKAGLKVQGIFEHATVRLPLVTAHEATVERMREILGR